MSLLTIRLAQALRANAMARRAAQAGDGQADEAFFGLLRDREVLVAMVGEVAGKVVAEANASEKGKTLKQIVRDHLDGAGGRARLENWVPRWLAFPPAAYTSRDGVGSVAAHALVMAARAEGDEPAAPTPGAVLAVPALQVLDETEASPLAA